MVGNGVQPVATIQIDLLSNGNLVCRANVPTRQMLNMMLETAKQDLVARFLEAEQKQGMIQPAPADFLAN